MKTFLDWRYATKADLSLRKAFVCTNPDRRSWDGFRRSHPAEWELQVQSWIRSRAICAGQCMLLGLDDQGIGAVSAWVEVEAEAEVLLQVIAVAMRYRHRDGSVAKELVAQTASRIEQKAQAAGARNLLVETRVDFRNTPSRRLLKFAGFEYEGRREELEIWTYARDFAVEGP